MNAFLTTRRRAAAATLAAGALLVGGAGAAIAPASAAPPSVFGSGTTGAQGLQGLGGAGGLASLFGGGSTGSAGGLASLFGGGQGSSGLPGIGLFKAIFAVFGAVQAQVPTIAAPIIAQAQTAGTITPAEATHLTTLLAAKGPLGGAGGAATAGSGTPLGKPSAGELTVLHSVITAVLGQLPTITGPVLAAEVTNGDLTQAEADAITKLISHLSGLSSSSSVTSGVAGSVAGGGGNLLSTLVSALSGKLGKSTSKTTSKSTSKTKHAVKHHHHKAKTTTTRTHHSG
jgi:hypothetical protein